MAKIIYQYLIVQNYFSNFRKGQQATGANAQLARSIITVQIYRLQITVLYRTVPVRTFINKKHHLVVVVVCTLYPGTLASATVW